MNDRSRNNNEPEGTPDQSTPSTPDPSIEPPAFDYVTEGFTADDIERRVIEVEREVEAASPEGDE